MESLIFQEHPDVIIASNTFRNIPIIIQYNDTPILSVDNTVGVGYMAKYPVYLSDGTQIAVVKGSSIHYVKEKTPRVDLVQEPQLTVCKVDGKPILELRRTAPQAFKAWGELYAPEGVIIKALDSLSGFLNNGSALQIGMAFMRNVTVNGGAVAIQIDGPKLAKPS
jgi:hypothetical protein